MAYQGSILYQLQEIDTGVVQRQKRLSEIEAELGNDVRVKLAQSKVESSEKVLKPLQTKQRDIELQIDSTKQKHTTTEQRLYSGNVKNPKELQDMQNELASLKRRTAELEDQLLEAMMEVEEAQETVSDAQSSLEQVLSEAEADHADLLAEKRDLEGQIEDFQGRRPGVVESLSGALLKRYEQLRPSKGNRPLALLKDGTNCGVCGVQLNNSVAREVRQQSDDLQPCPNCGRLLVYR